MGYDNDKKKSSALQNLGVVVGWYIFNIGTVAMWLAREERGSTGYYLWHSRKTGACDLVSESKQGLLC